MIPVDRVARAWREVLWLHLIERGSAEVLSDVVLEAMVDAVEQVLAREELELVRPPDEVGDELLIFVGGTVVETTFLDLGPYDGTSLPLWTTRDFGDELHRVILLGERTAEWRLRYYRLRDVWRSSHPLAGRHAFLATMRTYRRAWKGRP